MNLSKFFILSTLLIQLISCHSPSNGQDKIIKKKKVTSPATRFYGNNTNLNIMADLDIGVFAPDISSNGKITQCKSSIELPKGLDLSSACELSGIGQVTIKLTHYTFTAMQNKRVITLNLGLAVLRYAPAFLTYTYGNPSYIRGVKIALNNPGSRGGTIKKYVVTPSLPDGLEIDELTGIISGTPILVSSGNFIVTASNEEGSTTATLKITVNESTTIPSIRYTSTNWTITKNFELPRVIPIMTPLKRIITCIATPKLPKGITLFNDCSFRGTPYIIQEDTRYIITANLYSGVAISTTVNLKIIDIQPESLEYPQKVLTYKKTFKIKSNIPTSKGGTVVSYSMSPALPKGLTLNYKTGEISGTPLSLLASTTFTISASNTGGYTSTKIKIAVIDIAPEELKYSASDATYTRGLKIKPNVPSNTKGIIVSFSVTPPLPKGLSLNPTTGVISGLPLKTLHSLTYKITGANAAGNSSYSLKLAVVDDKIWPVINSENAPISSVKAETALWTGSEIIFFNKESKGSLYNPILDSWKILSSKSAPSPREKYSAAWCGSKLFIWGGSTKNANLNTGALYDPLTDSWTAIATDGAPPARNSATAIWTGEKVIVFGGEGGDEGYLSTGFEYDPVHNSWMPLEITSGTPERRSQHFAFWSGSQMIVWGGRNSDFLGSGAIYNPINGSWSKISNKNSPNARLATIPVLAGNNLIVWGGLSVSTNKLVNEGSVYNLDNDTWKPMTLKGAPEARSMHSSVWTGVEFIIWGGMTLKGMLNTGSSYDPLTDYWSTLAITSTTPEARTVNIGVWMDTQMFIWGGMRADAQDSRNGAKYNP